MEYYRIGCVSPHPPIIVPEVGGAETRIIDSTAKALERVAGDFKENEIETIVVISPHSPIFADGFAVKSADALEGSLSMFKAPQVVLKSIPDFEMIETLLDLAKEEEIPVVRTISKRDEGSFLDHGITVPLYFLLKADCRLVCLSISMMDYKIHYKLGKLISKAAEISKRKTALVASGDMSHRLTRGSYHGYDPDGEIFDGKIVDIMNNADYSSLFTLDRTMIDNAGECGLRSIFALAGSFDGYRVASSVFSYEGPFGVGYMVAEVTPGEPDPGRSMLTA